MPAAGDDGIRHHCHRPLTHQGTGTHAIGQPLAGAHDLEWPAPVLALSLPGVAVEIKATLMGRPVVREIAITPAVMGSVMLRTAKGPHVMQGPHDRLANGGDVGNREPGRT